MRTKGVGRFYCGGCGFDCTPLSLFPGADHALEMCPATDGDFCRPKRRSRKTARRALRKARVSVWCAGKAQWKIGVEGTLMMDAMNQTWRTVVVATYEKRASALAYAKGLRKGLRGRG